VYSFVHETNSKLESHDLLDSVICWCKKYRLLVRQEGRFVACFSLNVLIVHSSSLTVTTDGEYLTYGGFSLGEIVHFGSLEFITDYFNSLSLSPKGSDPGAIFVGMTHSR
jgi:hypothetical protein